MKKLSRVSPEDTVQITSVLETFENFWNKKDAATMASLFTKEAEFTDIMGQIALGKGMIETMHNVVFQRVMKNASLTQEVLYLREIAPHHVMVTCKWTTTGHSSPKNEPLPDRNGIMQAVLTSASGKWKISLIQNFDFTTMYNRVEGYEMKWFEVLEE